MSRCIRHDDKAASRLVVVALAVSMVGVSQPDQQPGGKAFNGGI
jgi:hypothetical protein